MSVKLDWEIVQEDEKWERSSPPEEKPKRRVPRRLLLALALIPVVAVGVVAAYVAWTYHHQLSQVETPVQQVARAELQAIADNDQVAFMALQDPDDSTWRALQQRTFGRLESAGLPEYGWAAMGAPPQIGSVSLEPGGALVHVTYQFSVTQPLPGEPPTVTVQIPAFYKATPSGWVHAMPTADLWGPERTQNGEHVLALYHQLDAPIVELMLPHLNDVFTRLCASLSCPSQVSIVFDNTSLPRRGFPGGTGTGNLRSGQDPLGNGSSNLPRPSQDFFGNGFSTIPRLDRGAVNNNGLLTLRLPSPYVMALPTDANSREQVYRVFESQLARVLVSQAFGRNLYMNRLVSQEIMQWELARVGLTGPFITEATRQVLITQLEAGSVQPLATIQLHSYSFRPDISDAAMMSLALDFLDRSQGTGAVERLIPALSGSTTLGDAIHAAFQVDASTLESAWQNYLLDVARQQDRQGA